MVVENVDEEEENIISDVDDRTLEEIIQDSQDDETQASESSRPQPFEPVLGRSTLS